MATYRVETFSLSQPSSTTDLFRRQQMKTAWLSPPRKQQEHCTYVKTYLFGSSLKIYNLRGQ